MTRREATRALAELFVRACVREIGPGYHPDTAGEEYEQIEPEGGVPFFTPAEAEAYDALQAWAAAHLPDVYEVAVDEWIKTYGGGSP
jgi:hypothetical protein